MKRGFRQTLSALVLFGLLGACEGVSGNAASDAPMAVRKACEAMSEASYGDKTESDISEDCTCAAKEVRGFLEREPDMLPFVLAGADLIRRYPNGDYPDEYSSPDEMSEYLDDPEGEPVVTAIYGTSIISGAMKACEG